MLGLRVITCQQYTHNNYTYIWYYNMANTNLYVFPGSMKPLQYCSLYPSHEPSPPITSLTSIPSVARLVTSGQGTVITDV